MKEVCRYVGWIVLVFSVTFLYGSRNADDKISTFLMLGTLVLSVIMLIYGYRKGGIKALPLEKDIIIINSVEYQSGGFETVNGLIKAGQTDKAVKELRWLINVSEAEATAIVRKWDEYCG